MTQRSWLRTGSLVTGACVLFAATALAQAPGAAPPPPPSVKVGQPAPDFTASYLKRDTGKTPPFSFPQVKLSDFKGQKNVVLAFFPAAFSPGCTNEMAKYQEQSGQFNANNTVILGMSVDSTWANEAFAEKLGVKFPILSDANRSITKNYGLFNEAQQVANRATFVIDKNGIVQKEFIQTEALDPNKALEACALLKEVK